MKKGTLNFLGTGSAFNTELGCNSAYVKLGDSIIFFDFGGDIFGRVRKTGICNDVNNIIVCITHLHPDHIGSLGDLIYLGYYGLKIKPLIICMDNNIVTMLELQGVGRELYEYERVFNFENISMQDSNFGKISITAYTTKHYPKVKASAFLLRMEKLEKTIYYSGDCYEFPSGIVSLLEDGEIDEIYQDTCGLDYPDNPHMSFTVLRKSIPTELWNKVYCMHLDEAFVSEFKDEAIKLGFNVVEIR